MSFQPHDLFHRHFTYIELDIGRSSSENPRLVQSLSIYRVFDPSVNSFRPIVIPLVQIFDPYHELDFHSGQPRVINPVPSTSFSFIEPPTPLQSGSWRRTSAHIKGNQFLEHVSENLQDQPVSTNNYTNFDNRAIAGRNPDTNLQVASNYAHNIQSINQNPERRLIRKRAYEVTERLEPFSTEDRIKKARIDSIAHKPQVDTPISDFTFTDLNSATPMVIDTMAQDNQQPAGNENRYAARPRPNFIINFDHLTERQKKLHKIIRGQAVDATTEAMNQTYNDELIHYSLNQNPSTSYPRVSVLEGILSIQEVVLEIQSWGFNEWKVHNNKEKAKSMIEGAFDIAFNVWHELRTLQPAIAWKLEQSIYELDLLYARLISILNTQNIMTPIIAIGLNNPLRQAQQSITQNNVYAVNQHNGTNNVPSLQANRNDFNGINNSQNYQNAQNFNQNMNNTSISQQIQYNRMNSTGNNNFQNNIQNNGTNRAQEEAVDITQRVQNEPMDISFNGTNRALMNTPFQRKFDDSALKITNTIKSFPNKFDGTQGNFMHHVQSWLAKTNEDITPDLILQNVEYLLDGEALKWHRTFGKIYRNWYDYAKGMQNFLNRGRSEHEVEAEFEHSNHNQKVKEDFVTYFTRIQTLANKLTTPPSAEKLYERIKRGLHPDYLVCKMTAKDISDLMAKCSELESTRDSHVQEASQVKDPFSWLKDRSVNAETSINAANVHQKYYKPNDKQSYWKNKYDNKWQNEIPNSSQYFKRNKYPSKPRQNFFHPRKLWKKNDRNEQQKDYQNRKNMRTMPEESDSDSDEYPAELTRGTPREINDSDNEYLAYKAVQNKSFAQNLDMNESDFLRYQESQTCSNCHIKGHTITGCEDIKKGIWYEHCKTCFKPNTRFEECLYCQKN